MVFNTNTTSVASDTTLSLTYNVYLVDAASGNITLTLPPISSDGMNFRLIRTDTAANTNTVTIVPVGGDTIDGPFLLTHGTAIDLNSYGTVWYAIQVASGGTIIPFASGPPGSMSIPSSGTRQVTCVGFGESVVVFDPPNLFSVDNMAFSMPRDGAITAISAHINTSPVWPNLGTDVVTITASIYTSTTNLFSALPGASADLSPTFTGIVAVGSIAKGTIKNIYIPVTEETRVLMVFSATRVGGTTTFSLPAYMSAGITIL